MKDLKISRIGAPPPARLTLVDLDDLGSLLTGDLDVLRNTLTAVKAHLHNHREDLDADTRDLWQSQANAIEDALTFLTCETCQRAAVTRRGTGEYLCAVCNATWTVCEHCHEDVLIADTTTLETAVGVEVVCQPCAEGGAS